MVIHAASLLGGWRRRLRGPNAHRPVHGPVNRPVDDLDRSDREDRRLPHGFDRDLHDQAPARRRRWTPATTPV